MISPKPTSRKAWAFFVKHGGPTDMKIIRALGLVFIAAAALWPLGCACGQTTSARQAPDPAIAAAVERYVDARQAGDRPAVSEMLTDEVDQLTSSGQWRRGKQQALDGMRQRSQQNPGARSIEVASVREVAQDVAIVDARYTIAGVDGQPDRQLWSTFFLVRDGQGWQITAIRNMQPRE